MTVTVIWRVVSGDDHPVAGEYPFTVGVAVVALGGALVAALMAKARRARED